ncbi:unnamed protein product [Closterium sp. NIES-53]
MASLRVLAFDYEGRPIQFDTWLNDLQLYLLSDSRDSVSLFDHTSGATPTPPAIADSATRSQTAQAQYKAVVARYSSPATAALGRLLLAYLFPKLSAFATVEDLDSHLRTTGARYRATLPAEFRTTFSHLTPQHLLAAETSVVAVGAARGTPRTPFFEGCSPSPIASTYASAAAVDVLGVEDVRAASASGSAAAARARVAGVVGVAVEVVVGAAVEVVEAVEVVAVVGVVVGVGALAVAVEATVGVAVVAAVGVMAVGLELLSVERGASGGSGSCPYVIRTGDRASQTCGKPHTQHCCFSRLYDTRHAEFGDEAERTRWAELLRSGVAILDLDYDAILAAMHALSVSAEDDCYLCVSPDPGIEAAALGASESALPGTAPAEALHTFTFDSGASRCFFRDSTTLTPLSSRVPVRLADPSGGPVLARSSIVLLCLAVPSGSLSGLHLPSFSTNLVSTAALQDAMVTTTTPGGQRVSICTRTRTGRHLATFTPRPGSSLYTLATEPPQVSRLLVSGLPRSLPPLPPSLCLPCVEGQQHAAPHSSFPPMSTPLQTLHMDVWGPARVSGQGREGHFLLVVDDYMRFTTDFPLRSKGEVPDVLIPWIHGVHLQLRERFRKDLPVLPLHSDRGGEFSSDLLHDFCCGEGILQSFTLPASPQKNGIAERRIGLVMEVARTSMIHAAAPHFLWLFAVRVPESGGAEPAGVESGGAEPAGVEPGGAESEPLSLQQLREWFAQRTRHRSGAAGAGDSAAGDTGAGCVGVTRLGGVGVTAGAGGTGGAAAAGPRGARTRGSGAAGTGSVGGTGAGGAGAGDPAESGGAGAGGTSAGGAGAGGAGAGDTGAIGAGAGGTGAGGTGAVGAGAGDTRTVDHGAVGARPGGAVSGGTGAGGTVRPRPYFVPLLQQSRPASPVRAVRTDRRVPRPPPPPVPGTHAMALRPSSVPLCVPLPPPPESSLPTVTDPKSNLARAACPAISRLLAIVVTDPYFESTASSALIAKLVHFATACRLDYATSLVAESESASLPSVRGECALCPDVLEDRQEDFECLAVAVPRFASMLLAPEGDPDAPDIPTLRSYTEAITGPYSSQWQAAMDAAMASWKSTGTYVDAVPPSRANIVDGMWIFRVKRPPGSPPALKARYVARGFSQRQGVDYFQTFSPTPKMTTLWVLLHVAAHHDYESHSLDFSIAFLQGSLHEKIWLRRPPGFTGSFPAVARHNEDYTCGSGFTPSTADSSLFLRSDTSLPPFYIHVYVDDLVFTTAYIEALTLVKSELQKRHTCTDLGELRSYLGLQIIQDRARRTITLTQSHMVHQVLQRFGFQFSSPQPTPLSTGNSLSAPPSDESVEPSGPYLELVGCLIRSGMGLVLGGRGPVVLAGHTEASWVDDSATQRSSQGYTFSLSSGSVSWQSTRSSLVLSSSCEAEIYAGAMAAQELRWLTYMLIDLGEQPSSPPVLYVDNKAVIALCQEHRPEHRTKHIALRYFLRELQQHGQLRLAYVATRANTADVFTKALPPGDHQRFSTVLNLLAFLFLTGLGYFGYVIFQVNMKLPSGYSGGLIPRLYLILGNNSKYTDPHDEIDLEFIGGNTPKDIIMHTNLITGGEVYLQQYKFPIDLSAAFHTYTIVYSPDYVM